MPEFDLDTTVRQVLEDCPEGRSLLFDHGFDVGDGFVDVLSQYQSLRDAGRGGRLRDVEGLLTKLNSGCQPRAAPGEGPQA